MFINEAFSGNLQASVTDIFFLNFRIFQNSYCTEHPTTASSVLSLSLTCHVNDYHTRNGIDQF